MEACISIVGSILGSLAGKAAEYTVDPVSQQLGYLFKHKSKFQNLKEQVAKLKHARERVQHSVDSAIRNAKKIEADVQTWLANVDKKLGENVEVKLEQDEEKAKKKCFIGLCPNFKSRYQLSKKAVEEAQAIIQLLEERKLFDKVSYSPALEGVVTKGYKAFESRNNALEGIMAALRESNVRIVGIHGMAGVGKTTLAKEVAVRVKEEHLFDEVAIATVSQNPDTKNIQGEIGDLLDLKYDKETVSGRAMQLRERLKTDKRILIVLDDIWQKLDLDEVGILFQDEAAGKSSTAGCKMLLTSRYLYVLDLMHAEKKFSLELLSQQESMILFAETVGGDMVGKPETIANELVEKCQGLPVAILAIANALKGKDITWWEDALRQLRQSNQSNIEGMKDNVYSTIELSYKWLRNDELQSLFLICGLHPQSFDIPVFDLLQYSMGLDLLEDINTLEEARKTIHVLVQKLKASSLLLEGKGYGWVKMHDLIRDVSISIASKGLEKRMLLIKDGNDMNKLSKKGKLKGCTAISLPHSNISELSGVDCSNLELLMLLNKDPSFQVSDTFFKDMRNLKVLSVTGVSFPSLPSSFVLVENLQTLRLCECKLSELGMIEKLKKLDILSFQGSNIKQLPVEVKQLTQLKLLDLSECSELEVIPADVIGKLCRLEELLVGNSFRKWDVEGNAKVAELNNLSSLSALDVSIPDDRKLPEQVLSRLERYKIVIGDFRWNLFTNRSKASKALQLEINTGNGLDKGIEVLVKRAEELRIEGFKGGKDMVCGLDTEGFPHLKYLTVRKSSEIEWIVNCMSVGLARREAFPVLETMELYDLSNLERICHGELLKTESFSQLTSITVERCDKLKNLFSSSIAKNLINQLQEIYVDECDNMTEIVEGEIKEENEVIEELEFRRLCSLKLFKLPKLKSFYTEKERASSSGQGESASNSINTTESKVVSLFNPKVTFPAIKDLTLWRIAGIERIWQDDILWVTNLTSLNLWECNKLKYVFSSGMVKSFVQLKLLKVEECEEMEEVIEGILGGDEKQVFSKLDSLVLKYLPKLKRFCSGSNPIEFPSLRELEIWACDILNTFYYDTIDVGNNISHLFNQKVSFPSIQELALSGIERIWQDDILWVTSLTSLEIRRCDKLKYVFSLGMVKSFVQLKSLEVKNCDEIEEVIEGILREGEKQVFPKLDSLVLKDLPNLKRFCSGSNPIEFPSLRKLEISTCDVLNTFYCDITEVGNNISHLFNQKVSFPILQELELDDISGIERIWHDDILWLTSLTSLKLKQCHKLKYVFSSCMVKSFVQFKTLEVWRCDEMEEVIEEGILLGEGEKQVFPKLDSLELIYLSKLKRFLGGSNPIELPSLKKLRIQKCSILKTFYWDTPNIDGNNISHHHLFSQKVLFPALEELHLESMGSFEKIWDDQLPPPIRMCNFGVKSLTSLTVKKCHKLKCVFSSCMVKSFVQLKSLQVVYCDEMEKVIEGVLGGGEEQVFSKLESLELSYLPELKFFCSGSNSIEFPSLMKLKISTCDVLNTFYCDTTDVGNNISHHHLFNQKVLFPALEELHLESMGSIEKIWDDDQLPPPIRMRNSGVESLTTLTVRECHKLKCVLSLCMVKSFVQLKTLYVLFCVGMEEVIDQEGILGGEEQVFPKLESLELGLLLNLKRFCSRINPIDFPSLRELRIWLSPGLNTTSIVGNNNISPHLFNPKPKVILSVLEELYVGGVNNLERLWPNQLADQYSFPKLTSIYLKNCGKLLNVFPSSMVTTLQGLKELTIEHCESIEEIIFETESRLQEDGDSNSAMQSQVIQSDVVISFEFPRLPSLALVGLPNLKSIHHKMHTAKWPLLEEMKVRGCEKVEILFGCEETLLCENGIPIQQPLFWVNKFTFPNLHCLTLGWNAGLKEIWNCYGHAQQQHLSHYFHNLKEVWLERYPKKVTTLPSYLFHLLLSVTTLQTLRIESCYFKEMMIFQSENGGEVGDDLLELLHLCKEGFQNLRILEVKKCPKLIHLVPSSVSFCNLVELSVSECNGIIKLITHSTAKTLLQLKQMKIKECENIEEIIEGGKDDNDDDEISFPQLNTLTLARLPKLESFCSSGNYTFRFPFLKTAIVRDCPKMEMFSKRDSNTPMLHQVKEWPWSGGRWEGSLNSTIKQLFSEQSAEAEEQNDMTEEPEISDRVQTNPSTSNTQNLLEEGVVQNAIKDEASSSTSNAQ